MANYYEDNEDLQFYVNRWIDWAPLVKLSEFDFRAPDGHETTEDAVEFYKEILGLVGQFSADEVYPVGKLLDVNKPKLVDGEVVYPDEMNELMEQIAEMGMHGLCAPRDVGGMNAPFILFMMQTELMSRADVSITAHAGFHGGIAMALLYYSLMEGTTEYDEESGTLTKTRFQNAVEEMIAGKEWGSMDITEPDAGSDMAAMRCRGEQDEEGNWFVTGPKIFITSGHGKYHVVIARTEDAEEEADAFGGLKGLSLFLVEAYHDDADGNRVRTVTVDGLEVKMGHNGSATVAISYDKSPAHLLGTRGEGFKGMLLLMNNARLSVGFECLGVCEAAYRAAFDYAKQRPSMGKTIDQHEMIFDYLEEMKTDIQGIRAIAMKAGYHEEMAQKQEIKIKFFPPDDPEELEALKKAQKRNKKASRHITPLLKYIAGEKAVQLSQRAIQIHGGCGYITEYGVEKLLRDAMVMPIYEGTSQIQALMAMKDNLLAAISNPQRFVRKTAQARWHSVSGTGMEKRVAKLETLQYSAIQHLLTRLAADKFKELKGKPVGDWTQALQHFDPKRDFSLALLHAEKLCIILTDVAIARALLEQTDKFPEREEVLVRHLERAEPRCRYNFDRITTSGGRIVSILGKNADNAEQAAK